MSQALYFHTGGVSLGQPYSKRTLFTVEGWFKFGSPYPNVISMANNISFGPQSTNGDSIYIIGWPGASSIGTAVAPHLYNYWNLSHDGLAYSDWIHVVIIGNSGVSDGTKLYINGVQKLKATWTAYDGGLDWHIGNEWSGSHLPNGYVQNWAMYNYAFSGSDVTSAYNNGKLRTIVPDANTLLLYTFDGNANDTSGNNHNGTTQGTTEYVSGLSLGGDLFGRSLLGGEIII